MGIVPAVFNFWISEMMAALTSGLERGEEAPNFMSLIPWRAVGVMP